MSDAKDKVLYLHGRPSAHPVHQGLARTITNDFAFIDEPKKWQENRSNFIVIFICWVINAFYLKRKKEYAYFLVDNLHITPILYKVFFPSHSRRQRFIVHLGSHTLYFMYAKKFGALNLWIHKWALSKYDALLCEGNMSTELAHSILGKKCPPAYTTFIGPLNERLTALKKVQPPLSDQHLLIIASGPSDFRFFYKGMDLMINAFNELYRTNGNIKLTIMGDWDVDLIKKYLDPKIQIGKDLFLENTVSDLNKYCDVISRSSLCIQVARGDAFPTSTLEAMAAGLPCLVSEFTGTKQVVQEVDTRFICKLDVNDIVKCISWYFSGAINVRQQQAQKFREAVVDYTETNAKEHYKQTFEKIKEEVKTK